MKQIRQKECGTITVFLIFMFVALMACLALVVDGGRELAAQHLAYDEAQTAARFGAGELSVTDLRNGSITVDPGAAIRAAERYIQSTGHFGQAWVSGNIVYVKVSFSVPTTMVSLLGISSLNVVETASAMNLAGVAYGS